MRALASHDELRRRKLAASLAVSSRSTRGDSLSLESWVRAHAGSSSRRDQHFIATLDTLIAERFLSSRCDRDGKAER